MSSSLGESEGVAVDGNGSNNISVSQSESLPQTENTTQTTQPSNAPLPPRPSTKRKKPQKRSKAWDHFETITKADGSEAAKCHYCPKIYCSDSKKNGTSTLIAHMNVCPGNTHNQETRQALLNLQKDEEGNDGVGSTLSTWKFDQAECRATLVEWVIEDELPFKFVEGRGFKKWVAKSCPRFQIPSRWTVSRDCYDLYENERKKLKSFMKSNCDKICITTDTWTSLQKINYMCVTGHFIDEDWRLHKKILNFVPVSSHKGDYIGKALESCLLDWGLRKVFTITVDNASSNDTAIAFLSKRMVNWGNAISSCKYLHMRCIAHVINLVVNDGLRDINSSVKRVRDAIRYIRNSPARWKKFQECVEWEAIESKSSLCLDVSTRWNSTYLMLKTAEKFQSAFERYDEQDTSFRADLSKGVVDGDHGVPTLEDWSVVRKYADLLKHFYESTLRISGSLYVTSSSFFSEISDLCAILNEWVGSQDSEIKTMGEAMKKKFDKYWGAPEKMNKIIFFAVVFDPHDKFEYMEYTLGAMYGIEKGGNIFLSVKSELYELFDEYKKIYQPEGDVSDSGNSSSSSSEVINCGKVGKRPASIYKSRLKKQRLESGMSGSKKNELDTYLGEAIVEDEDNFDLLRWWKSNSSRFPVLSRMARDILAVPISTVASESAFSTGGRVLDVFRSSLTPKIVEALICAQDWIRGSRHPICIEEQLEELEKFEKELPNVGIGGGGLACTNG